MWAIVGHRKAVGALARAVEGGQVSHAWLLTGPAGVGKTRLALELAKALNCTGEDRPDQVCLHCRQIEHGSHPDVTMVEPPEGKDSIVIAQVRELRETASLRPFQGATRVFVVSGAESLTAQAADAMLKTLEEPQPRVVVVLTATDVAALPETIISRCRQIALGPVSIPLIQEALRDRGADVEVSDQIARLSNGNVGWALRALSDAKLLRRHEDMVHSVAGLLDLDLDARLALAETLTAGKRDRGSIRRLLETLAAVGRDLLLVDQGMQPILVSGPARDGLSAQAGRLRLDGIDRLLHGVKRAMERVDANVDPRLTLEALFVEMP